jgi:hypothetical protein
MKATSDMIGYLSKRSCLVLLINARIATEDHRPIRLRCLVRAATQAGYIVPAQIAQMYEDQFAFVTGRPSLQ